MSKSTFTWKIKTFHRNSMHLSFKQKWLTMASCLWCFRWLNRQDIHLKQYLFDSYETLTTSNWLVRFSYWVNFGPKRPFKPKDFHSRKLVTFEYDIGFDWHNFWVTKDDITLKTNGNLSRPLWHSAKLWGKIEGNFFVTTKNCLRFYGQIFPPVKSLLALFWKKDPYWTIWRPTLFLFEGWSSPRSRDQQLRLETNLEASD